MAQPVVIFSHCLYSAKLNTALRICWHRSVGRALGRWSKDFWFEPAVSHYFSSKNVCLLAYVFTDGDPQLEWLFKACRFKWSILVWDKILIFSVLVSCWSRKSPALTKLAPKGLGSGFEPDFVTTISKIGHLLFRSQILYDRIHIQRSQAKSSNQV